MDAITLAIILQRAPRTPLQRSEPVGYSLISFMCAACLQQRIDNRTAEADHWDVLGSRPLTSGKCDRCYRPFTETDPWTP